MEDAKPKRQLSPEALEKLKYAREKALEAKRQGKLISKFEKEQKYEAKQKKREETYKAILELKKQKEPEPKPEPEPEPKIKSKPRPKPKPEPEPESEESEEEPPPPPKPQKLKAPPRRRYDKPEDKLYSNANVELLQQKLYEQTRRRLMSELFSY